MKPINIVFLDIDGVVNTPMWQTGERGIMRCRYNYPEDGKVNNFQSCIWVTEFCRQFDYKIVVSSTWRKDGLEVCRKCLYRGGIGQDIEIVGMTPVIDDGSRGDEINAWLDPIYHKPNYLIFDDDSDMGIHMDRLVLCRSDAGFLEADFNKARMQHSAFCETRI